MNPVQILMMNQQSESEYTPDVYLYNWRAIKDPKFAVEGWTSLTVDYANYIEQYCDYFGTGGLKDNKLGLFERSSSNGSLINYISNSVVLWLKEEATYASAGRIFWYYNGTGYYRDNIYGQDSEPYNTGLATIIMKYSTTNPGTVTDYDGNEYTTVKFGNYIFTVEPWKCKHLNDGTEIPYITDDYNWISASGIAMCGVDTVNEVVC